jgi:hypothetical protein
VEYWKSHLNRKVISIIEIGEIFLIPAIQLFYMLKIGLIGDSMKKIDEGVKNRLLKFVLKDKIGIRKSLLRLFSEAKSCNTVEIYDYLIKQGFNVNYRAVSSMVGQMHSRLGILSFYLTNEHNVYSLKEDYLNIVQVVLTPFSSMDSKSRRT